MEAGIYDIIVKDERSYRFKVEEHLGGKKVNEYYVDNKMKPRR